MPQTRDKKDQPEAGPVSAHQPEVEADSQPSGKQRAVARASGGYNQQHDQLSPANQPGYSRSSQALKPDEPASRDDGAGKTTPSSGGDEVSSDYAAGASVASVTGREASYGATGAGVEADLVSVKPSADAAMERDVGAVAGPMSAGGGISGTGRVGVKAGARGETGPSGSDAGGGA